MGHAGSPPVYESQDTQAFPTQTSQGFPQQQQIQQPQQTHMAQQHPQGAPGGPYPIPLGSLHDQPAWVSCPACRCTQMTRVEFVSGTTTHLWALGLCCCFCLGCIPYCVSGLKDVEHHCGQCGATLATYKRGSGTEVNPSAVGGHQVQQKN